MEKENENTMKNNVRFIVVALILAGVAALGFSRGAWAGPFMQGTVPFCPTTGTIYVNGQIVLCSSDVLVQGLQGLPAGFHVTSTETDVFSFGLPPGGQFTHGVELTYFDNNNNPVPELEVIVCFPDPSGAGLIYRWWTPADWLTYYNIDEPGRWVVSPTFNGSENPAGFTCTESKLPGVYMIVY
jgi:hypothetical protein